MSTLIKTIIEADEIWNLQPDFSVLKTIPKTTAEQAQTLIFSSPHKHFLQALTTNNFPERTQQIIDQLAQKWFEIETFYTSGEGFSKALDRYTQLENQQQLAFLQTEKEKKAEWKSAISLLTELYEKRNSIDPGEFIKEVIRLSFQAGASDLHFQPEDQGILLKLRLDGVLHQILSFSHEEFWKYLQKIKFISGVKMNIDYLPQDGRFSFQASDSNWNLRTVDARISFMPWVKTESSVIRFLDTSMSIESFEEIWFSPEQISLLEQYIHKTTGIIIITWPTGSGKTTTLYTILKKLNDGSKKIITLEDPIEYQVAGLQQSQINYEKGYTYELGLKAILRQDPDIILIWETRSKETASIAINAALTWHLVFTTLHTNSALESLTRLLNMGCEPFLLAPALQLVIGQRLVRKLCPHCSQKIKATPEQDQEIKTALLQLQKINPKIWLHYDGTLPTAIGCPHCNHSGYQWRIAILELLQITDQLKEAILAENQGEKLRQIAEKTGRISLIHDGICKILTGETTLEELHRVGY